MSNFKSDAKGVYILRASFTDKNGVKHFARDHNKRAFKIYVKGSSKGLIEQINF